MLAELNKSHVFTYFTAREADHFDLFFLNEEINALERSDSVVLMKDLLLMESSDKCSKEKILPALLQKELSLMIQFRVAIFSEHDDIKLMKVISKESLLPYDFLRSLESFLACTSFLQDYIDECWEKGSHHIL